MYQFLAYVYNIAGEVVLRNLVVKDNVLVSVFFIDIHNNIELVILSKCR